MIINFINLKINTCNAIQYTDQAIKFLNLRWVSGAPRRKPRVAKVRQSKTPTMLALDHFDFYYGPLYGKKWPSIRLGLLCRNKFVAVLNRFSDGFEINKKILEDLGTLDLIKNITKNTDFMSKKVEKKRLESIEQIKNLSQKANTMEFCELKKFNNESQLNEEDYEDEILSRTNINSVEQFRENKKEYAFFDQKKFDEFNTKSKKIVKDSDFRVTGLEGLSTEELPKINDFVYYPRDLAIRVFDRGLLSDFPAPIKDRFGISSWWLLDGSSVVPVLALDLNETDKVLDMCAAPGGKSMLIIQTKKFESLVCNDEKLSRLGQLRRGLSMYIPENCKEAAKIIIKRKDASSVESWDELNTYNKVLVDAPCTTDRLSVNQNEHNLFKVSHVTQRLNLPLLQTRLLVNALRSVCVGGSVVYSTCSLAPTQNECVVENAAVLAKQYYGIECIEQSLKHMEKHLQTSGLYWFNSFCKKGILILPTILSNFGPMYVCKLKRIK